MAKGDHIYVNRYGGLYSHHGIDCGDGQVVHYGATQWRNRNSVSNITLEEFARGDSIHIRDYSEFFETLEQGCNARRGGIASSNQDFNKFWDSLRGLSLDDADYTPDAIVARAQNRLGENTFSLLFNNCEHFASWCVTGISNSDQISKIWQATLPTTQFVGQFTRSKLTDWFDHTPFGH